MTLREKFIALVGNEPLRKADSIVVLEGDGFHRIRKTHELYEEGWAPLVLISGGIDAPDRGSYPAVQMAEKLAGLGVPRDCMLLEDRSLHTRHQAEEVMTIAQQRGWSGILLVASNFHQYRAYLTFLRVAQERRLELEIVNAPARDLPWFEKLHWGARIDLLEQEFDKIEEYARRGHVATFEEALQHQCAKERGGAERHGSGHS
jgi:uncharacterized SAM-binding protein YcdF (DUF218 family)